ncbi:MAG TPA: hypothetical protein PK467_06625 [Candidatus Wallbacteria bacterium]|nr:hypothetical protein [Candidatus Wallbacteria bacterium]
MSFKNIACLMIIMSLVPPAAGFAGASAGPLRAVFDNGANVEQYKQTIKKDLFYLPDEKFAKGFEMNIEKPKAETGRAEQVKQQASAGQGRQGPDENFRVEAIIKIGEKGCAVINSKLWYVGKNSFGYMLVKLNDESVEIKTPAGNIIKCDLIKKKAVETIDE